MHQIAPNYALKFQNFPGGNTPGPHLGRGHPSPVGERSSPVWGSGPPGCTPGEILKFEVQFGAIWRILATIDMSVVRYAN